MSTVSVYKGSKLLATGSMTNGATQITGLTMETGEVQIGVGRNVRLLVTSSTDAGKELSVRCTAESVGSTMDFAIRGAQGSNIGNPWAT